MEDFEKNFGKRLAFFFKVEKISQRTVAAKLDVSQQTVSEWVTGKSMPSLKTFAKLCQEYKLDASSILGIKYPKPKRLAIHKILPQ